MAAGLGQEVNDSIRVKTRGDLLVGLIDLEPAAIELINHIFLRSQDISTNTFTLSHIFNGIVESLKSKISESRRLRAPAPRLMDPGSIE
jgi:hypothetical protein